MRTTRGGHVESHSYSSVLASRTRTIPRRRPASLPPLYLREAVCGFEREEWESPRPARCQRGSSNRATTTPRAAGFTTGAPLAIPRPGVFSPTSPAELDSECSAQGTGETSVAGLLIRSLATTTSTQFIRVAYATPGVNRARGIVGEHDHVPFLGRDTRLDGFCKGKGATEGWGQAPVRPYYRMRGLLSVNGFVMIRATDTASSVLAP